MTVRTLREAGYTVMVAGSGAEALALPDPMLAQAQLLVTDVLMPDHDGIAVAASLRQRHPELRVLYVSGHADNFAVRRDTLPPKSEFLAKPFTPSLLLGRVRTALDS